MNSDAERLRIELLRRMRPEEKARLTIELTLAVQQLAFAGERHARPEATDDEIWLRLAERRLGHEIVLKVYGVSGSSK